MRYLWLLLVLIGGQAWAVNYKLPNGQLPPTCSANGNIVTCSSLNLGWNDRITVNSATTIEVSGNASLQNGRINEGGGPNLLTLNIQGNMTSNTGFYVEANLSITGTAYFGYQSRVYGNVSGSTITTDSSSLFNGNIVASNAFTLQSAGLVIGNITAPTVSILAANSRVFGSIEASNSFTLGSAGTITGNVTAGSVDMQDSNGKISGDIVATGTVRVGYGGLVEGSITANHINNYGSISGSTFCNSSGGSNPPTCQSAGAWQWLSFEAPFWLNDMSGNNRHGSSVGNTQFLLPDPQVSCEAVDIANNLNHTSQSAIDTGVDLNSLGNKGTISFWYRSDQAWNQLNRHKVLFDASTASDAQFILVLDQQGGISFRLSESDGDSQTLGSSSLYSFAADEWVHIAFSWDMGNDILRLFINGAQVSIIGFGSSPVAFDEGLPQLNTLFVGDNRSTSSSVSAAGNSADGLFDELRLYPYVQSGSQVTADMEEVTTCTPPPLQCLNDDFQSDTVFADNWQVAKSYGSWTPALVGGRVRLTEAANNQANRITFKQQFPAADNKVVIEFDYYSYNGNSADGISIVLSDATVQPQSGSFGGSLGYAPRNNGDAGFAGGWLGIGLDEYGNYSLATEGRNGGLGGGLKPDRVALRGAAQNNYPFLKASAQLSPGLDVPGASPAPGHRYRIVVDSQIEGKSFISVSRDTGSGFVDLIAPFDVFAEFPGQQPVVPEDFLLSITGSTGGSVNVHELDNIEICALKSEPANLGPHHYRLEHQATGYTCGASQITLKACANEDCSQLYGAETSLQLTSSAGSIQPASAVFTGTTSAELTSPDTGISVIGGQDPAPEAPISCYLDGQVSDCSIDFVEVGLEFSWAGTTPVIPHQISQLAFAEDIHVSLTTAQSCQADLQGQTLQLAVSCIDPASCNASQFQVGGTTHANPGDYVDTGIEFDADGKAVIPAAALNYLDAGKVRLLARNSQANAVGLSNEFVVKPATLELSSDAALELDELHLAGTSFNLTLKAVGANGATTANYRMGDLYARLIKTAPHNTGVQGLLGIGDTSLQSQDNAGAIFVSVDDKNAFSFDKGVSAISSQYTEVGTVQLAIQDADYLGAGSVSSDTLPLGRFIPAYYELQGGELDLNCPAGTYSYYMEEPFSVSGTLFARNEQGNQTYNYFGDLATATLFARVSEGTNLSNRLEQADGFALNWQAGQADFTQGLTFNRIEMPDGPFEALRVGVGVADEGGIRVQDPTAGLFGAVEMETGSPLSMRYGRAVLTNAYGPETDPLSIPLETQFFNGNGWQRNQDDNCTDYDAADLSLTTSLTTSASGSGEVTGGRPLLPASSFILSAPGSQGEVQLQWQVPIWLQYDWTPAAGLENPAATATFGVHRSNDRIIHLREITH
ncbi:DUF6701 domain-containing protein [Bowmanella dokdonensis]|uniref:DUF6701 domain-containing protein n=1 Tax=Bowmanella dokdonensis TaxID=751969 RepID=A0A939DNJ8_9ALTE|nr:DUF6701 domain-containing protein [Bowmanella dokdonensis]MBN7826069.1 hypothetical protein [Bowmanella dokdonensis]